MWPMRAALVFTYDAACTDIGTTRGTRSSTTTPARSSPATFNGLFVNNRTECTRHNIVDDPGPPTIATCSTSPVRYTTHRSAPCVVGNVVSAYRSTRERPIVVVVAVEVVGNPSALT